MSVGPFEVKVANYACIMYGHVVLQMSMTLHRSFLQLLQHHERVLYTKEQKCTPYQKPKHTRAAGYRALLLVPNNEARI